MEKIDHLNLNGRLLKLFLAVYDTGSVAGATQLLDLNQSTISYNLDRLREVFKDPLFVKRGRGIIPTDRAKIIAPKIRNLVVEMELLAHNPDYDPKRDDETVVVAANIMELLPYMKAIQLRLSKEMNNPAIVFRELGSRENIGHFLNNQLVDLIVSVRPTDLDRDLNSKPLFAFPQVCYYDPAMRGPILSVEDYCSAEHATLDFGGQTKSTIDHTLASLAMSRIVKLSAPNISALAGLVKDSKLISTMQIDLSRHALSGLAYCDTPFFVPPVHIDLIWHRRSEYSGRSMWLRDMVFNIMKQFEQKLRQEEKPETSDQLNAAE